MFVVVRSVPLSTDTMEAWRSVGGMYPRRDRSPASIIDLAEDQGADFILNLGSSGFNHPVPYFVWNSAEWVTPINLPGTTRELFPDLLPPVPNPAVKTKAWLKAPGRGGRGKELVTFPENVSQYLPKTWDLQTHIDGQEYRIITVGPRVVQSSLRHGDNDSRSYEWVGLRGTPYAVKELAREAAQYLRGTCVIGWDIIMENDTDKVFLLEGNACPGVNVETAGRIVKEIKVQIDEDQIRR
jgi:hypothetical protein